MAWVSVDLIGVQYPLVQQLRGRLPEYDYVLVASTHNHEGPDVIGVWGETYLQRGVHEPYLDLLVARMEEAVRKAEKELRPAVAAFGTANDESLLEDKRLPVVKDGVLRALHFTRPRVRQVRRHGGAVELPSRSAGAGQHADHGRFSGHDRGRVRGSIINARWFTSPGRWEDCLRRRSERVRNARGEEVVLREGDFALAKKYGEEVAALAHASGVPIASFEPDSGPGAPNRPWRCPTTNPLYRWARLLGIVRRDTYAWKGADTDFTRPLTSATTGETPAIASEVACLRLGELRVLCLPGELYPELVVGKVDDPARAGADYPDAAKEPMRQRIRPGRDVDVVWAGQRRDRLPHAAAAMGSGPAVRVRSVGSAVR